MRWFEYRLAAHHLSVEPPVQFIQLEPGNYADLIAGTIVGGKSHQIIQNDHVHGVGDLASETIPMRRFPGRRHDGFQDFLQPRALRVSRMEFDEARGALWIEKKPEGVLRGGFRGRERIKSRACMSLEVFAAPFVIGRPRRNDSEQRFRQCQNFRFQRGDNGCQRPALFGGRNDLRGRLPVAAQRERIIHAAHKFAGRFHLIAVQHVHRN